VNFWDSTAILPLLLNGPISDELISLLRAEKGKMIVWWGATIECSSAISRLRRMNFLDQDGEAKAREMLRVLQHSWQEISPLDDVREEAIKVVHRYPLKPAESLQLAAAVIWTNHHPAGKRFVSLDGWLREAAITEGFVLIPESI